MKNLIFLTILCLTLSQAHAQNSDAGMEISFTFNKQTGFSSNQYAVWIEDSRGGFVKTLYATKYTASGGWEKRPLSIPLWVEKSGLSGLAKIDIDAFSGATPRTGAQSYRWDGRDKNGNPAAAGEYRVFLEATLRGENRVLYSAVFRPGSPGQAEVKTEYYGSRTGERRMIENVRVLYRP